MDIKFVYVLLKFQHIVVIIGVSKLTYIYVAEIVLERLKHTYFYHHSIGM